MPVTRYDIFCVCSANIVSDNSVNYELLLLKNVFLPRFLFHLYFVSEMLLGVLMVGPGCFRHMFYAIN